MSTNPLVAELRMPREPVDHYKRRALRYRAADEIERLMAALELVKMYADGTSRPWHIAYEALHGLPHETSERCKHGVWAADHCYRCASENGK